MIGAIITQSLQNIEAQIEALQKEKAAIAELEQNLSPLVEKVQALILQAPNHGEKIKAWIAKELSLNSGQKSSNATKKPCPFKVGECLKVIDERHDRYGYQFQVERVRSRGVGWQAFDKEGNYFSSKIVEKVEKTDPTNHGIDGNSSTSTEGNAATETGEKEEKTEVAAVVADNNKTEEIEDENLSTLDKALAALKSADWKPKHIDFHLTNEATINGEDAIAIVADKKRTKGFLSVVDNQIKIGSELAEEVYLTDMTATLETVAPIWVKPKEQPMIEGINLGRGIKFGIYELSHENLMGNKLSPDCFKKAEWEELAVSLNLSPEGTRKQIANAICDVYQLAQNLN